MLHLLCEFTVLLIKLNGYLGKIHFRYAVWKFQDFCITENLREINLEDSRSAKSSVFAILEAVNFLYLLHFSLQKVQKFIKNQNSEPLNVLKWQILHLENP